jgi:hypothetical protein
MNMNRLFLLSLLAILLSCGKVPTYEATNDVLHFTGDFETGDYADFHTLLYNPASNAVIVTTPVRKGNFALKTSLGPNDYIFNGYRSELSVYNCATYKSDMYYGFSIWIDTNYSDTNYNLICQWQDLPNYEMGENWEPSPNLHGSSPPLALVYINGQLELKFNENPNSDNDTIQLGNTLPISKGTWIDFVFHMKWSDENDGFVEVWANGNPLIDFNGSDNKYYKRNLFSRAGNYFKFGQYRGKHQPSSTDVIYFDEVKIGSSYAEVAP